MSAPTSRTDDPSRTHEWADNPTCVRADNPIYIYIYIRTYLLRPLDIQPPATTRPRVQRGRQGSEATLLPRRWVVRTARERERERDYEGESDYLIKTLIRDSNRNREGRRGARRISRRDGECGRRRQAAALTEPYARALRVSRRLRGPGGAPRGAGGSRCW